MLVHVLSIVIGVWMVREDYEEIGFGIEGGSIVGVTRLGLETELVEGVFELGLMAANSFGYL